MKTTINFKKFTAKKEFENSFEINENDFIYLMENFHFFLNKKTFVEERSNNIIKLSFKTKKYRDEMAFESLNFLFAKLNNSKISTIHKIV